MQEIKVTFGTVSATGFRVSYSVGSQGNVMYAVSVDEGLSLVRTDMEARGYKFSGDFKYVGNNVFTVAAHVSLPETIDVDAVKEFLASLGIEDVTSVGFNFEDERATIVTSYDSVPHRITLSEPVNEDDSCLGCSEPCEYR